MQHQIVPRDEWLVARKAHLRNEKALTRMRDLVAASTRRLVLQPSPRDEHAPMAAKGGMNGCPENHPMLVVRQ
jgi:hypothetical protein